MTIVVLQHDNTNNDDDDNNNNTDTYDTRALAGGRANRRMK